MFLVIDKINNKFFILIDRELTKSGENRRIHREQIRKLRDDLMRANGEIDRLREQLKRTA